MCIIGILLKEQEFTEVRYRDAVERSSFYAKLSVNITVSAIIVSGMV